jgi:endonuclease/exonuclease/phosphatase family metal-dependent hydrolase
MNKKGLLICLTLALIISLSSCIFSTSSPSPTEPDETPASDTPLVSEPISTPTDTPKETESEPAPTDTEPTPTETETVPEPEPEPFTLNIGSFNIANGSNVHHDMNYFGDDIKNLGLDIVGLQEVDQFVPRSKKQDTVKLISEYSGLPYYAFFKAIDLNGGEYGVAILSRYPIVDTFYLKLYSGTNEQRVIGGAKIDVNGTIINFFSTHLSFEAKSLRNRQFSQVASLVEGLDNFIITGDFNTSDFSEYAPIKNAGMVNNSKHSIYTFPSTGPSSSIDNIVYSTGNWTFENPEILKNKHSDHCMLYAVGTFTPSKNTED